MDLRGKTAIVTGASSGLGVSFARQLAQRGADVIAVARRRDRLEKLAAQLREAHGVRADVLALDLGTPDAAAQLFDQTEGQGRAVDVLINNAGFASYGWFTELPWELQARQIQLNVVTLTELTWRFARAMRQRRRGWILNVSSIGGYVASPAYATYSAGKAFVKSFSQAAAYELRGTGVTVTSLVPGLMWTEFHKVASHTLPGFARLTAGSAEATARAGLRGLFAGRKNVVAGFWTKLMALSLSLVPDAWAMPAATLSTGLPSDPRRTLPPDQDASP